MAVVLLYLFNFYKNKRLIVPHPKSPEYGIVFAVVYHSPDKTSITVYAFRMGKVCVRNVARFSDHVRMARWKRYRTARTNAPFFKRAVFESRRTACACDRDVRTAAAAVTQWRWLVNRDNARTIANYLFTEKRGVKIGGTIVPLQTTMRVLYRIKNISEQLSNTRRAYLIRNNC